MERVSVIMVNFNGKKWLKDCLDSVYKQTYPHLEIIAVDNASTDGSKEFLQNYPLAALILITNPKNLGYAQAVNQGIKKASGEFIIPLNTDIVLLPSYVEEMVKAVNKNKRIGSVSGKLLRFEEGGKIIDSVGHIAFKNRLIWNRGDEEKDEGQYDRQEYTFGTCGAASLYKKEMLEDVKIDGEYYDEDFFAFWEDVDLDWRANLRGWKCLYTPKAQAYHYRGGIRLPRPRLIELNNYRNRYLAMLKNDFLWGVFKNLPQIIFTETLRTGALFFRRPSALLGWFDILRLLPKMIRKRRMIQKKRAVSFSEMEKWFQRFDYRSWIKKHLF